MKKNQNKSVESTAVTVAQPLNRLTAEPLSYKSRVSDQYAAIETAKDNLLRECVKFGALLTEVGYFLGEGRGHGECGGLQTWLAKSCPEVNYKTAMGYKALAGKCVKMLGGGSQAVAVLQDKTEVIPPGEEEPIEVESKVIKKRDELFSEVKSRRDLEQTYFKFMASEGRRGPGRPKGSGAAGTPRAKTAEERVAEAESETREILGKLLAFLRGNWLETVSQQTRDDFARTLRDCAGQAVRIAV